VRVRREIARQISDDLVSVAKIPSPTFEEGLRVAWLEQRLEGAPGRRWRDRAGNLIWSLGDGPLDVLVTAHVDTVFDLDTPLSITRKDGHLCGPGVGDNAAAVAVAISVFSELRVPSCSALAFTVGEEGLGNLRGVREAVASLNPRSVIALEGHGLDRVIVDAVGSLRIRVTISGPGGHPWVDRGSPSAIHAALAIGASLTAASIDEPLINVGTINGGRSVNSIAERIDMLIEARSVDTASLEAFHDRIARLQLSPPLEIEVETVGSRPAGHLDRDGKLLQQVLAVRKQIGLPPTLDAGSTDANLPLALGIPAVALGVATGGNMHTAREWISEDSLRAGYLQVATILARLTNADDKGRP
jgi:acetylornithine deacetylase/succinyl-diaminopimelate desuccinylase-like protein